MKQKHFFFLKHFIYLNTLLNLVFNEVSIQGVKFKNHDIRFY